MAQGNISSSQQQESTNNNEDNNTQGFEHAAEDWLDQVITPFNACSLETLTPIHDSSDEVIPLIIGCYQLNEATSRIVEGDEKTATRSGELRLYAIKNNDELRFDEPHDVVNMESGVLDGKWRKREEKSLFASACASGRIHLHSLQCKDKSFNLRHVDSSEINNNGNRLCLSLAWNEYINDPNIISDRIVSSYSDGTISLHDVFHSTAGVSIKEHQRWNAHAMLGCPSEVWTCSFLRGDDNLVISGADDVSFMM